MGVRSGYKKSEVGVIPSGWEVMRLGSVGRLEMGKGLLKDEISTTGDIPAIPYTSLYTDFSEVIDPRSIKWFVNSDSAPYVVNSPCVLIASSSNVSANTGKACALHQGFPVAVGREVIAFITSQNVVFISYLLGTSAYRKKTLDLAKGITIKHVYPTTFVEYTISLPPISEQSAIADALNDVDVLLATQDALIAKKRSIKQGAMQALLTGERRLPGCSEEWSVMRLGDVLSIRHGRDQKLVVSSAGRFPILATGGQIGWANRWLYDKPSVLIGRKGTIDQPQYMDTPFWTVDTLFYSELKGGHIAKFFYYVFCLIDWSLYNEASGVPSLNAKTIESIEVRVPSVKEQAAITDVLNQMDNEIAALQQQRDKTAQLKQGMMQQLLTGRIRLI